MVDLTLGLTWLRLRQAVGVVSELVFSCGVPYAIASNEVDYNQKAS